MSLNRYCRGSENTKAESSTLPDSPKLEIVRIAEAKYPYAALAQGIRAEVWVELYLSEKGELDKADVVSGDPTLAKAGVKACRRRKFKPCINNGKPIKGRPGGHLVFMAAAS